LEQGDIELYERGRLKPVGKIVNQVLLGIGNAKEIVDMRLKDVSDRSRAVLKALAKVGSYEQVLAADRSLTAHDVFRALSESPTGFWDRRSNPKQQSQTP